MKTIILFFVLLFLPILCEAQLLDRDIKTIDTIIIHHSDSPDVSAKTIEQWHKEKGFYMIGYHFVIRQDGSIEKGRPLNRIGAHAGKKRNKKSIGICLTGYEHFTVSQLNALENLIIKLSETRSLKIERHHRNCPGSAVDVEAIAKKIQHKYIEGSIGFATHYQDFRTAKGENMYLQPFAKTAASWFYPIGTKLKVYCFDTNEQVIVTVNDRGPNKELVKKGRIIDLSPAAFKKLAPLNMGIIYVKIERIYEK